MELEMTQLTATTGLRESFIRRCLREMKDYFKPYIRTEKNKKECYDVGILEAFEIIKLEKSKGNTVPNIKKDVVDKYLANQKKEEIPSRKIKSIDGLLDRMEMLENKLEYMGNQNRRMMSILRKVAIDSQKIASIMKNS